METLPAGRTWRGAAGAGAALGTRRVAVAVSRYNEPVTGRLLDGALFALAAGGVPRDRVDVAWVPGAFELPLAADRLAATGGYAAVLCLGAIIRGETSHDRHIATAVGQGIEQAARRHALPIPFGVLTCDTLAQALARAAGGPADGFSGNKGAECATAALEMISLLAAIPS
ncbi:MAG: 6,7-dimethyl-8-ribityllumazine synthase [Planctomycetia bacterium]|nr:6,7-dimethyl-8-ribityllumazine synthase [Planctomycetia bacterium]